MSDPTEHPPEGADSAVANAGAMSAVEIVRRRRIVKPEDLAAAIKAIMVLKGIKTSLLVSRVPRRHVGTIYRLLAGRTTDPWASTIVSLCTALTCTPDELFEITDVVSTLDPEIRNTLTDVMRLNDGDKALCVAIIRLMCAFRPSQGMYVPSAFEGMIAQLMGLRAEEDIADGDLEDHDLDESEANVS